MRSSFSSISSVGFRIWELFGFGLDRHLSMYNADIVNHILSFLHSDQDYTSLETCSVVFPQFVDRHLYSQITLDVVDEGLVPILPFINLVDHSLERTYYVLDPTDFYRTLIDHPHIANYVRLVQIIIKVTTSAQWLSTNLILQKLGERLSLTSSILSTLPHLESILVKAPAQPISWHMLGPKFSTAFQNSVLPSIKSVSISNMENFPLDHFDDCKNLEDLSLDGRFLHGEVVSTSSYPHLCSLHMDGHHNLTRAVSWMKSNTLHTLSLRLHVGSRLPDFQTLFEACSTTLVNLDVNHNYNSLHNGLLFISFPDLRLPCLDHLTFRSPLDGLGRRNSSPLSLLVLFLGSIKTLSSLSPIRLTLYLHVYHHVDWSLVIPILTLPIFRHPIELYFSDTRTARVRDSMGSVLVVPLLEQNSDMKRLLEDGKLVTFMNEEWEISD